MIELRNDKLVFRFPDVHEDAVFRIDLQRTLRIPDDKKEYPLPPGLGSFPLRHVDDYADGVPEKWIEHGGVMFPMYQSEAMWLNFSGEYPMAVKIATGKINAVTGEGWKNGINRDPQDYVVIPEQPWLDGYCVEKGVIAQFVAMPLGSGYSAEEQLTGEAEHGGIQIVAYPMKRKAYEKWRTPRVELSRMAPGSYLGAAKLCVQDESAAYDMGLAPGGRMRQKIYDDTFKLSDWDLRHPSRCFIHIANSVTWEAITGNPPPTEPPTAKQYNNADLPWFDLYDEDKKALKGAGKLKKLKSVAKMSVKKGKHLAGNKSIKVKHVVALRKGLRKGEVRDGAF